MCDMDNKIIDLLHIYRTTGNKEVYEQLYIENIKFIRGVICKTIKMSGKSKNEIADEYFGVACLGFNNAIEGFDINKENSNFFAFASICIRNCLLMEINRENRHNSRTISINDVVKGTDDITIEETLADEDNGICDFIEEDHYSYKKRKVLDAINKLNNKEKEIIMAYYGFNGKPLTKEETADMFNVSISVINKIINALNLYLVNELKEFKDEYTRKQNLDLPNSSYVVRFNKEIGNKYDTSVRGHHKEKEKMKRYQTLVQIYGEKNVKEAINLLNERNKRILFLYYGIEGNEVKTQEELGKLFNLINIDYVISSSMKRVEIFLKENNPDIYVTSNKGKKLYELIGKYGEEKIKQELLKLDETDRNLIEEYYAFGARRKKDRTKYELSKKYDISNVPSRVYNILNMIGRNLLLSDKVASKGGNCASRGQEEKMKKYNILVQTYGEKEVLDAISKLGQRNSKIMILYYGLSGDSPRSQLQLGEMFNLKKSAISGVIMTSYDKLLKILNGKDNGMEHMSSSEKKEQKFQRLVSLYGKENVVKAIFKLSERDRQIMILYFGINESGPKTQKELSEKFNLKRSTINMIVINSYTRIEKELEKSSLGKEILRR